MLHGLWHAVVLGSTLFAAAGIAIVLLAPLIFEEPGTPLERARPAVLGLAGAAVVLLLVEWLLAHERSL